MIWEVEQVRRAGTTVLIFYKFDEKLEEGQDRTLYVRGQIVCQDQEEIDRWLTVLPILNSNEE